MYKDYALVTPKYEEWGVKMLVEGPAWRTKVDDTVLIQGEPENRPFRVLEVVTEDEVGAGLNMVLIALEAKLPLKRIAAKVNIEEIVYTESDNE